MLHFLGKTYGRRPSAFIEGLDEYEALGVDLSALKYGSQEEELQQKRLEAQARAKARIRG